VNSLAWIGVVVVLEAELWLQVVMSHRRHPQRLVYALKIALYATLGGAALYWGIAGTFLDFWDAMLWIACFAFIELNVFRWGATDAAVPVTAAAAPGSAASSGVWRRGHGASMGHRRRGRR
jgi:hypothetical protein